MTDRFPVMNPLTFQVSVTFLNPPYTAVFSTTEAAVIKVTHYLLFWTGICISLYFLWLLFHCFFLPLVIRTFSFFLICPQLALLKTQVSKNLYILHRYNYGSLFTLINIIIKGDKTPLWIAAAFCQHALSATQKPSYNLSYLYHLFCHFCSEAESLGMATMAPWTLNPHS